MEASRVRGSLTAVAVLTLVLAVFGSVVLLAEAKFGASSGTVEAAAVSEPVQAPDAAAAQPVKAPAEAAAQPVKAPAKAAPKARPALDSFQTYADYQRSIITTIDSWWESALARAGVSYNGPQMTVAGQGRSENSQCGRAVANPTDVKKAYPAFYCRGDKTVYLSSGWLYAAIFSQFHKGGVAAIIAHEFGHHVQHAIGIADPLVSKQELQADCLAGIWVHAAVRNGSFSTSDVNDARKALRALGDNKLESKLHHGTPGERTAWFDKGLRSGDAYVCNHF